MTSRITCHDSSSVLSPTDLYFWKCGFEEISKNDDEVVVYDYVEKE